VDAYCSFYILVSVSGRYGIGRFVTDRIGEVAKNSVPDCKLPASGAEADCIPLPPQSKAPMLFTCSWSSAESSSSASPVELWKT